jgi:hypothetical protein
MKRWRMVHVAATSFLLLYPGVASASLQSIAQSVLDELLSVRTAAILLAVGWFGVLIVTRRASLLTFFIMLFGIAMLRGGGYF